MTGNLDCEVGSEDLPLGIAPVVGVVVLTQGNRPDELAAALASIHMQHAVRIDLLVVGNGWRPVALPDGVRSLYLPDNVGIPAGRNAGIDLVRGDFVLFLDDDARLATPDFLQAMLAKFDAEPKLGLVQARIDATVGSAQRRWVPRVRDGDPRRSSAAFSCCEGAVVVRRTAFVAAGGWPDRFGYAHEGIDLAMRLWDTGSRVWYAGDVAVLHPPTDPRRHVEHDHNNARNRVWIARRNIPWPLSWIYVLSWTAIQIRRCVRARDGAGLKTFFAGLCAGWRTDPGPCRRMRWATVWRMTLHGRPPII